MLNDEEINIILKDLLEYHNYDFTYYSRDSFKRRLNRLYKLEKYQSLEEFRNKLKTDKNYIDHFIDRITVNVTEMFRDYEFFRTLRQVVIPDLSDRPVIRVWHPGCSTGEEVYSVAILLHEEGLLDKSEIYGTDVNSEVLKKARKGIFPVSLMQLYAKNYNLAGGQQKFSSYFTTTPEGEKFNKEFGERMTFKKHNLATDGYLAKFDLIVCRNVLIYFDKESQLRALQLFDISTSPQSFLTLGEKETIKFSTVNAKFKQLGSEKIWKKL